MAKRPNIVRMMPQKSSFFDSVMSKDGIGGYNWEYDTNKKCLVRRPGYSSVVTVTDSVLSTYISDSAASPPVTPVALLSGVSGLFEPSVFSPDVIPSSGLPRYYLDGTAAENAIIGVVGDQSYVVSANATVYEIPAPFIAGSAGGGGIVQGRNVRQVPTASPPTNNVKGTRTFARLGNAMYSAGLDGPLLRVSAEGSSSAGPAGGSYYRTGPGAVGGGAGVLTGTYKYATVHRYRNLDGSFTDGPISPITTFVAAAQTVLVTGEPSANICSAVMPNDPRPYAKTPRHVDATTYTPTHRFTTLIASATPDGGTYYFLNYVNDVGTVLGVASLLPGQLLIYALPTPGQIGVIYVNQVAANGSVQVNGPVVGTRCSTGETIVLLRTVAGGDIYYERGEFPGLMALSDNMADAALILLPEYAGYAYSPAAPSWRTAAVTIHQQKLVVAVDGRATGIPSSYSLVNGAAAPTDLIWSEPFVDHFPVENSLSFRSRCKKIIGLASVNDLLYVMTDNGVFYVQGDLIDPTTYSVSRLSGTYVCASAASVTVNGNVVRFISTQGELVTVSGSEIGSQPNVLPLECDMYNVTACVDPLRNRVHIFAPLSANYTAPDYPATVSEYKVANQGYALVIDDTLGTMYSHKTVSAIGGCAYVNGYVYTATREGDLSSRIFKHDYALPTDDGAAIEVVVQSIFEDAESPHVEKQFTRLSVFAPDATSEFTLGVQVERDWDQGTFIQSFDQEFRSGEGYAVEPYATDAYGDANTPEIVNNLNNHKAKSLRVTLTHENALETPSISGWALEYNDSASESREN